MIRCNKSEGLTDMRCIRFFAVSAIAMLLAGPSDGLAVEATAKQKEACAPDVFRLCKPHVPDVDKIVVCMERARDKLSPACSVVFTAELIQSFKAQVTKQAGR